MRWKMAASRMEGDRKGEGQTVRRPTRPHAGQIDERGGGGEEEGRGREKIEEEGGIRSTQLTK